jgi:hypothetical protein
MIYEPFHFTYENKFNLNINYLFGLLATPFFLSAHLAFA